jgi:hypothetical protein
MLVGGYFLINLAPSLPKIQNFSMKILNIYQTFNLFG